MMKLAGDHGGREDVGSKFGTGFDASNEDSLSGSNNSHQIIQLFLEFL